MDIAGSFRESDPVPIRIPSRADRGAFAAALARAIAERRYSDPRGDDVFLRLSDGSATTSSATFNVKTYVAPGIRSGGGNIDKRVAGSFSDTPSGSEFAGLVSAPIARWTIWLLTGWVAFMALSIAAFGVFALLVGGVVILAPLAVAWPLLIRHSQRASLRKVGSLTRFLQRISNEAEAEVAPHD